MVWESGNCQVCIFYPFEGKKFNLFGVANVLLCLVRCVSVPCILVSQITASSVGLFFQSFHTPRTKSKLKTQARVAAFSFVRLCDHI